MPYKDKEKQNKYQRERIAKRRANYFEDKSCVVCGRKDTLELDHIDRATKVSHKIWSWSESRRNEELAKCQVLCHEHHLEKTISENKMVVGELSSRSRLKSEDVLDMRARYKEGILKLDDIGAPYGMDRRAVYDIVSRRTWKHI